MVENNQDRWNLEDPNCFSCGIHGFRGRIDDEENSYSVMIRMYEIGYEPPKDNDDRRGCLNT